MIRFESVYKSFKGRRLFDGLNLELKEGKTTAILGPNGSGKTTLVKMILGLVVPDRGRILVDGRDARKDAEHKRLIGYMPQIPEFPENLSVKEIVSMVKDIRGQEAVRFKELIELLNLEMELDKRFSSLSGGTRQKVGALVSLAFDPPMLILDEPMVGLDPISAYRLKRFILEEKQRNKTVLFISHIMSEVEEVADYVVFLAEGRKVFDGSLEELKERTGKEKLEEAVLCLLN
ncbi:ABC transporter ATP-binding protein [Hydrogenobacter thermophilus]|uniref:ABC transporter ATP-binding protein n=1 Tax=Hydrogenobacter thermophilus TaxID=940 RepID=UPI0030F569B6